MKDQPNKNDLICADIQKSVDIVHKLIREAEEPPSEKLYSYHFDCGNSNGDPIGFCARIRATSADQAVERLMAVLPEEFEMKRYLAGDDEAAEHIEYINIYFGHIKQQHIDAKELIQEG